ncbi:MAG: N-acetyltransferase [Niameybacter sp.]|uniref:N-acetyltransferase n=1 Tax=Niameybacter sp. TaxID=2033640 RepID=UPI002FCA8C2F
MLRKYRNSDIDEVMNLWLETNIVAHDFIDKSYWQGLFEIVKGMMADAEIYVFEDNNKILAFLGLIDGYIAGVFVNQEQQSKGIGKLLVDYAKEQYDKLSLSVYHRNRKAYLFYTRQGFVVEKEQVDENTNEKEYVMEWRR